MASLVSSSSAGRVLNVISIAFLVVIMAYLYRLSLPSEHAGSTKDRRTVSTVANSPIAFQPRHIANSNLFLQKDRMTLVLGLSVGCPWCQASAPFYRQIIDSVGEDIGITEILPQPTALSRDYLAHIGLPITRLVHADLSKIGIEVTPTIILLSKGGDVVSSWVGRLTESQEQELFDALGVPETKRKRKSTPHFEGPMVLPTEVSAAVLASKGSNAVVLDVRPRADYARGHVDKAINIPVDEIETRAIHELATNTSLAVYCHSDPQCESRAAEQGLSTVCSSAVYLLRKVGFASASIISRPLAILESEGVRVTSTAVKQ